MVTDVLTVLNRKRVFEFAAVHRIPAMYEHPTLVRDGGLMAYGPDAAETATLVAGLIDRILSGSKPADLPFEQPQGQSPARELNGVAYDPATGLLFIEQYRGDGDYPVIHVFQTP